MVVSVAAAIDALIANGGDQPIGADAPEITARFRDPAGNIIGIYQEPSQPSRTRITRRPRPSFAPETATFFAPRVFIRSGNAAPTGRDKEQHP